MPMSKVSGVIMKVNVTSMVLIAVPSFFISSV